MNRRLFSGLFCSAAASLCLCGCSSIENSHLQKAEMMKAYETGDNAAVENEVGNRLKDPKWYNTSVVNTGDELMWRLEAGSLCFHLGKFRECIEQFKAAERLIESYDERATVSIRDTGSEAGAALTNLNALPYRGFCRDRIALAFYKSLAYLGTGNESAFLAQIRRIRNEQKIVQEKYREFFEREQEEIAEAKRNNSAAAKKTEEDLSGSKMENEPDNEEYKSGLKLVREAANRGYGNFLNPAAIFLSGLGSLREGNYDNARIDFQRIYQAMPSNPMSGRYYVTALKYSGNPVPGELAGVKPFEFPLDRDCVYVIFANGKSASFKQIAVYFPVMAAWPMCEFHPAPYRNLRITADGEHYDAELLADMDGIIAQEFNERLPGIITRIVLGTIIKDGAYYGALTAIMLSDMNPLVKAIVWSSVAIGGAAYRTAMNTADTRSWEMLPKEFRLTQFPMPRDRKISLSLDGGLHAETICLPGECRSAILFVSAPGGQNVKTHVLQMKTR